MSSFKKILLCYDSTREGARALRQGADLAQQLGAETHLLAIVANPTAVISDGAGGTVVTLPQQEETAQNLLDYGVSRLRELGLTATGHLAFGQPIQEIPAAAHELGVDLIVVGHKTRSAFARWWSGPGESRLLDLVSCCVLVAIDPADAGST